MGVLGRGMYVIGQRIRKPVLVLLICGFVVGYSFKPILDTSRFDLIKNEFESREAILKEQLQCGKFCVTLLAKSAIL